MSKASVAAADRPLLVFASHAKQFHEFCKQNNLNPTDRNIRYIIRPDQLCGINSGTIVSVGPYLGKNYTNDIYDKVRALRQIHGLKTVYYET